MNILNGQKINGCRDSFEIPMAFNMGLAIKTAKEPFTEKTTNIMNS